MSSPVTKNVPLSTQIADQLRERIASGELPVGSRLPTEAELVETLGVSRNSVREATRSLVHSGLLVSRAGDGTYVRAQSELGPALQRRAERGRTDDVIEVRSMFERFGAGAAALHATDDDIAAMRAALIRRNEAQDAVEHVASDLQFHRAVMDASGNALAAELYRNLHDIEAHLLRVTPTGGDLTDFLSRIRSLNAAHDRLLEAIEAHDPETAERIAGDLVAEAHALDAIEGEDAR
ncbi:FadR/GntR family transcriptional regulator [Leifsonia poae]|uniref:FadR/GntR family transcriptional regulator n=1 Tax=Leifsonia poae TaxID=110933 RepID=UPI001CBCA747|nr:GntR family transcriptional regulator [Leifsonia poae]